MKKRNYIREKYSDEELKDLLQSYVDKGYSSKETAIAIGSSERTVSRWKKHFGLNKPPVVPFTVEDAVSEHNKGLSANEIARKHGVSVDTVIRRLSEAGIELNRVDGIRRRRANIHDMMWSDIEYDLNKGLLKSEIISKYKISASSLNNLIKRHAYTPTFVGDLSDVYSVLESKDLIRNSKRRKATEKYLNAILDYVAEFQVRPTGSDLARFMGLSVQTVASWFKDSGNQALLDTKSNLSYMARFVCRQLNDMGLDYELDNRQLIAPLEIDIWIPSLRVGIEINPTTSHAVNKNRRGAFPKDYHQKKSLMSLEKKFRLIHVFDWDIEDRETFPNRLHAVLYPEINLNVDVLTLDLNKPLITEHELLINGFTRLQVSEPVEYLLNRNSCRITDVIDRNTVSVFDAGQVSYKRIKD